MRFNPYFPFGLALMDYVGIYSIISGIYATVFSIYIIIKRYENIKEFLLKIQSKATSFLVRKKEHNLRVDFLIFLLISITIAFSVDIIMTKLSKQDFVTFIIKRAPVLKDVDDLTSISATENLNSTIGFLKAPEVKFESLKIIVAIFFGPTFGALILFFLRQLRYRVKMTDKDPGARILFLFLIITAFILMSDILYDISKGYPSMKNISFQLFIFGFNDNGSSTIMDADSKILLYGIGNVIQYAMTFLINPYYYFGIIAIWAFDWYLFSKMWT